jgi:hypothetical protein
MENRYKFLQDLFDFEKPLDIISSQFEMPEAKNIKEL